MSAFASETISQNPSDLRSTSDAESVPSRHQKFLGLVRNTQLGIPSLDTRTRQIVKKNWYVPLDASAGCIEYMKYHRPVINGRRVAPSALLDYRCTHKFLGPVCLCALFPRSGYTTGTEAAMFFETTGPYSGEFVAKCAKNSCGFLGR